MQIQRNMIFEVFPLWVRTNGTLDTASLTFPYSSAALCATPRELMNRRHQLQLQLLSGMARVRLADQNGPKWTSSGQNGPFWSILVSRMLNKIPFGIRPFWPKWSKMDHFGPFWPSTLPDSTAATPYLNSSRIDWPLLRGRHGGLEKRGGRTTSRRAPLPKKAFGPPPLRLVRFPPPSVSPFCFFFPWFWRPSGAKERGFVI